MQLLRSPRRPSGGPSAGSLAVFPAAFHPPTRAHLTLVSAALTLCDSALLVLPKRLPHKDYDDMALEKRAEMVLAAVEGRARCGVAVSEAGLFVEIAREVRENFPHPDLWFLCGRDAAERVVGWDYAAEEPIDRQLESFGLLVADRRGAYMPPDRLARAIRRLPLPEGWSEVSSSEARRRMERGGDWRSLVPEEIADLVARTYSR